MKLINIKLFDIDDGHLKDMITIDSEELCISYADVNYKLDDGLSGLQSDHEAGSEIYLRQLELMEIMRKTARELDEISI